MKHWGVAFLLAAMAVGSAGALAEGEQPTVQVLSPQAGLTFTSDSVAVQVQVAAAPPAKISSIELSVDGFLHATRSISPPIPAGTCTLLWDTPRFANGEHVLTVTAKDSAGKTGAAELRVVLARPRLGTDELPLVEIERPRPGERVSGVTTVDVKASHPSGIKYVMIFVDDLFSFMANRPPFSYSWDTRRAGDGLHTLVARAQAGTNAEADSSPVQVTVDNQSQVKPEPAPGGVREVVMADTRSARVAVRPVPPTAAAPLAVKPAGLEPSIAGPAASVVPAEAVPPRESGAIADSSLPAPAAASIPAAPRQIAAAQPRPIASPAVAETLAAPAPRPASAGPVASSAQTAAASGSIKTPKAAASAEALPAAAKAAPAAAAAAGVAVAQAPRAAIPPIAATIRPLPVATAAKAARAIRFAPAVGAEPRLQPQVPEVKTPRAAPTPAPERRLPAMPAPARVGPMLAVGKPAAQIRLYYNGVPLETDVPPVIRAGISAGPFRHIIEHSGGQVFWHPESDTVTANALAKDITLTIGSRKAIVNNSVLIMDLETYLEKGRAMVPLRFFRDALDFTVEYDAATGRICIQR